MKVLLSLFLIVLTILCFSDCGRNKKSVSDLSISLVDSIADSPIPSLPPLEEGVSEAVDKDFGALIKLEGQPLTLKEIIKPNQLLVKDKYLITNNQRSDSIFMIFELPDLKCVASFGIKGTGPGEFNLPRIIETAEDSILFYVYEYTNEKIYKIRKNDLTINYYLTLPRDENEFGGKQLYFLNDGEAVYATSEARSRLIKRYIRDSVPQIKAINNLAIPEIKNGSWTTYIGDFGGSIENSRMVFAYKYYKRLKIIDMETMKERSVVYKAEELAEGQGDIGNLGPSNVTHFWGMSPCREFFYMLYSGRSPVDVQRDNRSGKKYIFMEKYDWNGNPVTRYELDDWGYFCVDESNNTLYLASTISIHSLLRYDISGAFRTSLQSAN